MKQQAMPINLDELPAKRAYNRVSFALLRKVKLNTAEGRTKYVRQYALSAVVAGGQIYSFTCDKVNGEQPTCTRTYEAFSRDLGISVSIVCVILWQMNRSWFTRRLLFLSLVRADF